MFCILHIFRSYPLDCYDYRSTSGADKQPRYILRQKKQNRYGGEKEGEGKEIKYFWMNLMRREAPWYLFLLSRRQLRSTAKTSRNWDTAQSRWRAFRWSPEVLKRCWSKVFFLPFFLTKKYKYKYITPHFHYWLLEPSVRWCWKGSSPVWWRVRFATASQHTPPILRWIFDDLLTWAEMPFHAAVQTPDQISEQCSRNLVKIVKIWSKELVNVVKYCKTWSQNKILCFCCRDMGGFKS